MFMKPQPASCAGRGRAADRPLGLQLTHQHGKARDVAPGRARLATSPVSTGSATGAVTTGIFPGAFLAASVAGVPRRRSIDVERAQLGGEIRVAANAALCVAILDEQVLTLDITKLPQPFRNSSMFAALSDRETESSTPMR